jgi:hypothetical protein
MDNKQEYNKRPDNLASEAAIHPPAPTDST